MIFDSPEEKNFIQECVRKYPCNYEQALQLANTFGQSIQDGQVIDIKKQHKAFPPAKAGPPIQTAPVPAQGSNGKRGPGKRRKSTV